MSVILIELIVADNLALIRCTVVFVWSQFTLFFLPWCLQVSG